MDESSGHMSLSRASSTDSIEARLRTTSDEAQELPSKDDKQAVQKTANPSDDGSQGQAESMVTPPRPNTAAPNGNKVETTLNQDHRPVENQGNLRAQTTLQSHQQPQLSPQKQQQLSQSTTGTTGDTSLGTTPPNTAHKPSMIRGGPQVSQPRPTTPVKGISPTKASMTPHNPFAQGATSSAGSATSQPLNPQLAKQGNIPPQPSKVSSAHSASTNNLQPLASGPPPMQNLDSSRPGHHQRTQSLGNIKASASDFDPLRPRAETAQADVHVSQEQQPPQQHQQRPQQQIGQVYMMDQQAMTLPIVGYAATGMKNSFGYTTQPMFQVQQQFSQGSSSSMSQRQPAPMQPTYQDVQQMFLVPQHQLAEVDLTQPHMMAIQQPILQFQSPSFAGQPAPGWNNAPQQVQPPTPPTYAQVPSQQVYSQNAQFQQQQQQQQQQQPPLVSRQSTNFDPLQTPTAEPPSAAFDPLHPQASEPFAQPSHGGDSAFRAPSKTG